MDRRLELHTLLKEIVDNVYFQPPESVKLVYPCIVYSRGVIERTKFANDKPYLNRVRYALTLIDLDPDSELLEKVAALPMCIYERHFAKDNLNHDIYNIYY